MGLAQLSEELRFPSINPTAHGCASMGPRSAERGISSGTRVSKLMHAASMGPRSAERGIALIFKVCRCLVCLLQWGLAQLSEELVPKPERDGGAVVASMGPRSAERGICPARRIVYFWTRRFNGASLS